MEKWWTGPGERMLLSDDDKIEIQDITGQLPILLRALCRINLDCLAGETPEADTYASKLARLYDYLWNCADVESMITTILLFAREKTDKLWDSPMHLRYLNR